MHHSGKSDSGVKCEIDRRQHAKGIRSQDLQIDPRSLH